MLVPALEQPLREWRGGAWAPEQESRLWARPGPPGLWLGGISGKGKNQKGTLSGIPSWQARLAPGLGDSTREMKGLGSRRRPRVDSGLGGKPLQALEWGPSGRGGASPRICEVELCRACSPIFWMALKYTSAAWDRAAWGQGVPVAPAPPPSAPALWRPLLAGEGAWRGQGGAEASGSRGVSWVVCMDARCWPGEEAGVEWGPGQCVSITGGGAGVRVYPRKGAGRYGVVHRYRDVGGGPGWQSWGGGKQALTPKS